MLGPRLNIAPAPARAPVPPALVDRLRAREASPAVRDWAAALAAVVDGRPYGVVFQLGALRLPEQDSREIAIGIAEALADALKQRGAPRSMYVERDDAQTSYVPSGHQTRTLLPHHDSAHGSFLAPSCLDDPSWDPAFRRFGDRGITTRQTHKMYQGFIVLEPGEALSVTTFYDKVALVRDAYCHATGASSPSLREVVRWLGANIRRAWEQREAHGLRYLTLGAALGATEPGLIAFPVHWAESDIPDEVVQAHPELAIYRQRRDDGVAPAEALFSAVLERYAGYAGEEFRRRHELCVASERYDFVIGHNLTNLHGGLMGGPSRYLEPICLVMDEPAGDDYERWVFDAWRLRWPR